MNDLTAAICDRLASIRRKKYGSRGRSKFARDLGIRPSTYANYESHRLPPADILLKAARLTRTRLEWLITGEGKPSQERSSQADSYGDQLADGIRDLLHARPELIPTVDIFLHSLQETDPISAVSATRSASHQPLRVETLIPIVGSTSAGTAHFWRELPDSSDGPAADSRLEDLLNQCGGPTRLFSARFDEPGVDGRISLIQLSQPDERGILEFLEASTFKQEYPDCVAWRIDGESMSPRFEDGDLVLTSPQHPAQGGQPCVARQRGQIGVNCKLYQRSGDTVQLIPINPVYPPQELPAGEVQWAWRVLARVRLQRPPSNL